MTVIKAHLLVHSLSIGGIMLRLTFDSLEIAQRNFLTTDLWSSCNIIFYMALTAHFLMKTLDRKLVLQSLLIGFHLYILQNGMRPHLVLQSTRSDGDPHLVIEVRPKYRQFDLKRS